ncbi:hypothetical protein EVAR_78339_1 [Eumeta japonica]|uniref:PiggyBac transposable element-derived protein domain-containing protein n=1 Tax=Eumeta variegata TaxID=151549 RepID=A0A4C1T5W9_EUMVA|nr:hypothetical protein EVAR_78339_1 [Eumeta japonica]
MVVHQGDMTFPELTAQGFTWGESAILRLCETLVPGHYIFLDRYFTIINLADALLKDCIFIVPVQFNETGFPGHANFLMKRNLKRKVETYLRHWLKLMVQLLSRDG